jgi:hypothetical protein
MAFDGGLAGGRVGDPGLLLADIPSVDQHRARHPRFGGDRVGGHEAAHAVTGHHDPAGVDVILGGVGRIEQEGDRRLAVGAGVGERELAGAAPRAAIVDLQHVPAGPAHGLHQVDIGLVAGEAVQEQQGGVRLVARGQVHQGVDPRAAGREPEGGHVGRMDRIASRIGHHSLGDRREARLGVGGRGEAGQHHGREAGGEHALHREVPYPLGAAFRYPESRAGRLASGASTAVIWAQCPEWGQEVSGRP